MHHAWAFLREFQKDIVRVAGNRESRASLRQIAADFGISGTHLRHWMHRAAVEPGTKCGMTAAGYAMMCVLREAESSVGAGERGAASCGGVFLRYPLGKELAAAGIPAAASGRVLKPSRQPHDLWLANPITDREA